MYIYIIYIAIYIYISTSFFGGRGNPALNRSNSEALGAPKGLEDAIRQSLEALQDGLGAQPNSDSTGTWPWATRASCSFSNG